MIVSFDVSLDRGKARSSLAEFNVSQLLKQKHQNEVRSNLGPVESVGDTNKRTAGVEGNILMSVVASLEKRFAQETAHLDDSSDEEQEEEEAEDMDTDEDNKNDSEDAVDHAGEETKDNEGSGFVEGEDTSAEQNEGERQRELEKARLRRNRKRARRSRKANKEEREWFDEGKGFLVEDLDDGHMEENDHLLAVMETELEFNGFYVHRGPLLSKERAAHFQRLRDGPQAKKGSRSNSGDEKVNSHAKKGTSDNKVSLLENKPSQEKALTKASVLTSTSLDKNSSEMVDEKVRKLVSNVVKRLHLALEEEAAKAKEKDVAKDVSATGPEGAGNGETSIKEKVLQSFTQRVDRGLLVLAPFAIEAANAPANKVDRARANLKFALYNIRPLFPGLDVKVLERHLLRVKAGELVSTSRKHHLERIAALEKYVAERRTKLDGKNAKECLTPGTLAHALQTEFWAAGSDDNLAAQQPQTTAQVAELLEQLYYKQTYEPKTPMDQSKDASTSWADVQELVKQRWQEAIAKQSHKVARQDKVRRAQFSGMVRRRVAGNEGSFRWDADGISLMQRVGMSFKSLYLAATRAWDLENELLGKQRTMCRSRKAEMAYLASKLWSRSGHPAEMDAVELLAITCDSIIPDARSCATGTGPDLGEKRKRKRAVSEGPRAQSGANTPAESGTAVVSSPKKKRTNAPLPVPKEQGLVKGRVFETVAFDLKDFDCAKISKRKP